MRIVVALVVLSAACARVAAPVGPPVISELRAPADAGVIYLRPDKNGEYQLGSPPRDAGDGL